jgi:spore maturation protein CgeB
MRIFQTIEAGANAALSGNRTWYRNLYEPLTEMGHDVVLYPADEGRLAMQQKDASLRSAFSEKLLGLFRQEQARKPFDLFFAYLMDDMVEPGLIDEIRHAGVITCNFSCNNAHQFYLVDELSPHFDYNLHSEKSTREKFLAIGARPLWWPMASNPKYFKPQSLPRTLDVSFVGYNYALRAQYVAHLLENGIDVHAYGPGWLGGSSKPIRSLLRHYLYLWQVIKAFSPVGQFKASATLADHDFRRSLWARFPNNLHPPVPDDELISLYSRSQISLGFLEVYDRHDPTRIITQHLHLREFEAPMSGALYCTGYSDELAEFFDPDKEVLVYRNRHELLDKIRYYLTHQEENDKIRQAGRKRALDCHTYHHRFQTLFKEIGLEGR